MLTRLLTVRDAAEKCGVSQTTIRNWLRGRYSKTGGYYKYAPRGCEFPEALRFGRRIRIRESDLNRWIKSAAAG